MKNKNFRKKNQKRRILKVEKIEKVLKIMETGVHRKVDSVFVEQKSSDEIPGVLFGHKSLNLVDLNNFILVDA